MLRERRRREPPRSVRAAWTAVTARVRRLVDDVHDGNLLEAAAHSGVPYATLREIHAGRTRRPSPEVLERLAQAYRLPVDWFSNQAAVDDGTVPLAGWVGFLPEAGGCGRRITIPYSAWPLIRVLVQLEQRLRDQPAHPDRPIVGSATDPREIRGRLTTFILQPLLAANAFDAGERWWNRPSADDGPPAVMLRDLGRFWERALASLVPGLVPAGSLGEVA